ncbi:MAG: MTH938/NDUFAF3 family protein [Legionellales bacterium]|nr:MTH938/NDUFAF3 family protein [Legionellales bacterium]
MHIQREPIDKHTIRAYSDSQVKVGEEIYVQSLIISKQQILSPWSVTAVEQLTESSAEPLLQSKPDVILLGHAGSLKMLPMAFISALSKQRIGLECMSVGAACRTFNVLLSEGRKVVVGIIFESNLSPGLQNIRDLPEFSQ